MSQNPQRPKEKIEAHPHNTIIVNQPMVRNFSTGGGHGPEDTIVEGDDKIVTKKWQGYPPQNLKLIGKPNPPMPEVAIPRYTGKAEYATRVQFPNMLFAKMLTSPHPRARIRRLDDSSGASASRCRNTMPDVWGTTRARSVSNVSSRKWPNALQPAARKEMSSGLNWS